MNLGATCLTTNYSSKMANHPGEVATSTDGLPQFEENPLFTADRTSDGYNVASNIFDAFADVSGTKKLQDFTRADMLNHDGQFVRTALVQFASFLLKHKQTNGKHYKPDTMTQYLSGAKTLLAKKFPRAPVLKKHSEEALWYNELYGSLRVRGRAEAIKRGDPVKESTLGIRRKLLKRISKHLVQEGTQLAYSERAILNTLYAAVGHGGEVSTVNMDILRWDEDDEALWTAWNQSKTGRSSDLSFHPDAESYLVDDTLSDATL